MLFICLTAIAGSILNTYDNFAYPAITPVVLNLSLIASVLFAAPYFEKPVFALAWAFTRRGNSTCFSNLSNSKAWAITKDKI